MSEPNPPELDTLVRALGDYRCIVTGDSTGPPLPHAGHTDITRAQIDGGTGGDHCGPDGATVCVIPGGYVAEMRHDSYAIGWRVLLTGLILIVMVLPSGGIGFGILGALLVIWGGNAVLVNRPGRRARYR